MAVSSSLFSQLATFKSVVKPGSFAANLLRRIPNRTNNVCLYSTATAAEAVDETAPAEKGPKKMSKAMLAYLERAKAHDQFMKHEQEEYNIGKRHLANMMGEDPEHFTQKDVERAIEYLLPSGLFDKAARPVMKPPEELFPPRKAAQFDETGRPFHAMFYTTKANYYQTLYDIVEQMESLNALEDDMMRKGVAPDPKNQLMLSSSDWMSKKDFESLILENIWDSQYEYFISTLQRLIDHPYAYRAKDFIMKYRTDRKTVISSLTINPLEYDSDGRPFITVPDCMRKSARGTVTVRGKGSGKITINGQALIRYFPKPQEREQIFKGLVTLVQDGQK